jgi:hypothetical protein
MPVRPGPEETLRIGEETVTIRGTEGFDPGAVRAPNPNQPNVFIINGEIVVDQEPLRPGADSGNRVVVVWALARNGDYSFPNDEAIVLLGSAQHPLPPDLRCKLVGAAKKEIACKYKRTARAQWKYKIAVKNDRGGKDPDPLDPWIHQN